MTTAEIATLRRSIDQLRHSVQGVRQTYGDSAEVRRLVNDLERLEIDAAELASARLVRQASTPAEVPDAVVVPDTPHDEAMFADADDEGIGGYHGDRS
ncbi:conserved hypothetical protein [Beutenbergia cavernae DSM 12333]|uniref:Uncharacterized protein n=1 Tax=Beutenbergia cavernae (strain ATCC BAA-8 / DSM 12333 / CCUG 43141 / JCM 11478 / NBRC 16432 / NCIMB 13614 / HKI 0122) TaxID=471853 RepID=C5C2W5_BEUC1|nr:hypothetical protein [Beutenbergia cavernae]ACQ81809.1 conserved hypothetical protein [Beutenbergia cavernae DSM 12333]